MPVVVGTFGVIAIGRMLAVTLEAADWGWTGTVWGLIVAGLEAIGRMLAVFGGSDGDELNSFKKQVMYVLNPITYSHYGFLWNTHFVRDRQMDRWTSRQKDK